MTRLRITKLLLFLAALVPLARLVWKFFHDALGANPIEVITHTTGDWTLILIMVTLSITPLRKVTKQYWLIGIRRMIGLFAFFYGCLHFTTYLWLDKFFDVHEIIKDVVKRPFITMGFLAFVCLLPLAFTSTKGWIRRLGKNWQRLHRLIYVTALAGVIHYIWLVKADLRKPLQYAFVLSVLLTYRIVAWVIETRKKTAAAVQSHTVQATRKHSEPAHEPALTKTLP
jgi:sulfoxide reductase heme-binding subunit YedZ